MYQNLIKYKIKVNLHKKVMFWLLNKKIWKINYYKIKN